MDELAAASSFKGERFIESLISLALYSTGKTYDFYKDSNVQEVVACLDVLQEIRGRVQKELQQWPDHAVLNDVSHIPIISCCRL